MTGSCCSRCTTTWTRGTVSSQPTPACSPKALSLPRSSRQSSPLSWQSLPAITGQGVWVPIAYLTGICQRATPEKAQVWRLNAANRPPEEPWDFLKRFAQHNDRSADEAWAEFKLSVAELAHDPLSWIVRGPTYSRSSPIASAAVSAPPAPTAAAPKPRLFLTVSLNSHLLHF